ncbi:hypothetical protein ACWEVP_47945, partial [Amycolatopsis sp. NPDC003865]
MSQATDAATLEKILAAAAAAARPAAAATPAERRPGRSNHRLRHQLRQLLFGVAEQFAVNVL